MKHTEPSQQQHVKALPCLPNFSCNSFPHQLQQLQTLQPLQPLQRQCSQRQPLQQLQPAAASAAFCFRVASLFCVGCCNGLAAAPAAGLRWVWPLPVAVHPDAQARPWQTRLIPIGWHQQSLVNCHHQRVHCRLKAVSRGQRGV